MQWAASTLLSPPAAFWGICRVLAHVQVVCRRVSGCGVSWSVGLWPMQAFLRSKGRHGGAVLSRVLLVPQYGDKPVPPNHLHLGPWIALTTPAVETG